MKWVPMMYTHKDEQETCVTQGGARELEEVKVHAYCDYNKSPNILNMAY